MSIKVSNRVWEYSSQSSSDLLLLQAIAYHADDDGVCWPGISTLAKKTRCSERQAQRNIEKLEKRGEIFILHQRGRGNSNLYFIATGLDQGQITTTLCNRFGCSTEEATKIAQDMLKKQRIFNSKGDIGDAFYNQEKVTSGTEKGDTGDKKVTSGTEKGDIAMSPESSLESSLEPSLNHQSAAKPPARKIPEPIAVFKIFVEETSKCCLNSAQIKIIQRTVGADPPALDRWRETVRAWNLNGNKLTDAAGMLDWFTTGKRSNYPKNGANNGHKSKQPGASHISDASSAGIDPGIWERLNRKG
jgi:hypothetical protein